MPPEPHLGNYEVTARLFKLIGQMPIEHQLALLKQLAGRDPAVQIFKLIVEMSEQQQLQLLEQLSAAPPAERPVKTLSLEETGPTMREHPRRSCLIKADYEIRSQRQRSYVLDVSIGGVFIETDTVYPVGEPVILQFSVPHQRGAFALRGKVAWSGPRGFGVKFDGLSAEQERAIRAYVGQEPS